MQELRFVAVSEDGSYAVLAVPGRSGRYILPIDERLRAVAMGQTSRLAQYEIEVESPLRPKEIQARIRAGETAEEIADAAGIPVERVRWFEGPVLAERAYIADQAQTASVRRAGDSGGPGPRLGDIVPERLTASGADPGDGQWDSRKRGDGHWQVTLTFPSGGRLHIAEWVFDSRRRHVMPNDDNAARLSLPESELPPEPVSLPGEATVTPLAPRLGAAAGMGGGAMGGGFAGGVRSFRPERSVIPDRSLGGDRSLADRPLSPPAPTRAPASAADRPVMPERPAMSHSQAAPPVPPRPAQHDQAAVRDGAPDPIAHRAPAPEQQAPEQRAPEQPSPAGTVPVTAPPYVFEDLPTPAGERAGYAPSRRVVFEDAEPAFRDEQIEYSPPSTPSNTAAPASPASTVGPLPPASVVTPTDAPLPRPPVQPEEPEEPEERLRQPGRASAREFASSDPQTRLSDSAAAAQPVTGTAAVTPSPSEHATEPRTAAVPTVAQEEVSAPTPAAASAVAAVSATDTGVPATHAPAKPKPASPAEPAEPASAESPAASAATTPAQPEPGAGAAPAAAPPAQAESPQAESPQAESAQAESAAEEQSARQRPGSRKSAKGRRSSVPSWDEIMLGSSRQRD